MKEAPTFQRQSLILFAALDVIIELMAADHLSSVIFSFQISRISSILYTLLHRSQYTIYMFGQCVTAV